MKKIAVYDTTLRDGTQAEEINLSTNDKVRIARKLDDLAIDYIEGGWPGSNTTDKKFFKDILNYELKHSRITAFGSTHNPKNSAANDANLKTLVESKVKVTTIFGKTWDLHAKEALRVGLDRNLELIGDSLAFLRPEMEELFFDAEHFFDGYKKNPDFALACLKKARDAGADVLVLCDTNGGCMTRDVTDIVRAVAGELPGTALGIHAHNDTELAVANSIAAVEAGATQVQGTINGYGERCGNANLCSIVPNLQLKFDGAYQCLPEDRLKKLTTISNYVSEVANLRQFLRQPFVGRSAFAHKGGIHVSAVMRNPRTYEHVPPETVGNRQRVLLSDLAGRSNILFMAKKFGYDLDKNDAAVQDLLAEVKDRESIGYEYSAAEASFELLFFKTLGWTKHYFTLMSFRLTDVFQEGWKEPFLEASVMVKVGGSVEHTAATGKGPVNALDKALRKGLARFYPNLADMRLSDFKVRVLTGTTRDTSGTASNVRVLIESTDKTSRWSTVGVSYDVINASWQALVDSINYKLFKDDTKKWPNPDMMEK